MHTGARLWAPLLALLAGCRGDFRDRGVDRGVEGAEEPRPRTRAQAFASLALVRDSSGQLGSLPVIAVREGKVLVFLPGVEPEARMPSLTATYLSADGTATETVSGASSFLRGGGEVGRFEVLAFPAPRFAIVPAVPASALEPEDGRALRVVELREGRAPLVQDLTLARATRDRPLHGGIEGTVPARAAGRGIRAIFDERTWHLVALAFGSEVDVRGARFLPLLLLAAGEPRPVAVRLEKAGEGCRVSADVEVDDPLGTILEVGLLVGEPGVEWAIPELDAGTFAALRDGPLPKAESHVVPVANRFAARARPDAPGRFRLSVPAKECDRPRFVQVVLLGQHERRLSWPYRLSGGSGATAIVSAGADAWRREIVAATEPLEWKGLPLRAPPPPGAGEGCRAPLPDLDPGGVYLVGARGGSDPSCADGWLVFPPGAEERAGCAPREKFLAVAADGRPVYAARRAPQEGYPAWRRAREDRNEKDGSGSCRLVFPRLDDDVLASWPCPDRTHPIRQVFVGPGSDLVFDCDPGYRRRDGTPLDVAGAGLLRVGEQGSVLVRLPWGTLGVRGPDGRGREVGGLPWDLKLTAAVTSAAIPDGFLVALEHAGAPADLELFHVPFTGAAASRGRFAPLGDDASAPRALDPEGALYTFREGARGAFLGDGGSVDAKVTRWQVGGGSEVVFENAGRPEADAIAIAMLLVGWRSAGTARGASPSLAWELERWSARSAAFREKAIGAWTPAPEDALPCTSALGRLDPDRVWLRVARRILDPADPARFRWAPPGAKLTGDGRLMGLSGGQILELSASPAALRPVPDGSGCAPFAGGVEPVALASGACAPPEPQQEAHGVRSYLPAPRPAWAALPQSGGVLLQCPTPDGSPGRAGDRELPPGYVLVHAGMGGRLLAQLSPRASMLERIARAPPSPGWLVSRPGGRWVAIAGLPWAHAVRAIPQGFLVVVAAADPRPAAKPGAPPQRSDLRAPRPLELLRVGDDGRTRKLLTIPPLAEGEQLQSVAVTPDSAVHVLYQDALQRLRLVRWVAGSRTPAEEWASAGAVERDPLSPAQLLTGP